MKLYPLKSAHSFSTVAKTVIILTITFISLLGIGFGFNIDVPTIAPEQIKPGMTCEIHTVVKGTEPTVIKCEVIGVRRKGLWIKPIYIKLKGDYPVAGGMSGSPVFIDGKLAGALSAGYIFPQEPVAIVTPISEMLKTANSPNNRPLKHRYLSYPLNLFTDVPNTSTANYFLNLAFQDMFGGLQFSLTHMPLSSQVRQITFEDSFPVNFDSKFSSPKDTSLRPGDAISVFWLRGDFNFYVTGTVTYVDGKSFIAFGHPMVDIGRLEAPVHRAEVLHVFKGYFDSFKISNALNEIGVLSYDGNYAVYGKIGERAKMIPITYKLITPESRHTYHIESINNNFITPLVMGIAHVAIYDDLNSVYERGSIRVNQVISLKNSGTLKFRSLLASTKYNPALILAARTYLLTKIIYNNPYSTDEIEKLSTEVEALTDRELPMATITKVNYYPIDDRSYHLTVFLRDFYGRISRHEFNLIFPVPQKYYRVAIVGGPKILIARKLLRTLPKYTPSLKAMIQVLNDLEPYEGLYVLASFKGKTVSDAPFSGDYLSFSLLTKIKDLRDTFTRSNVELKLEDDIGYIVTNLVTLRLKSNSESYPISVSSDDYKSLSNSENIHTSARYTSIDKLLYIASQGLDGENFRVLIEQFLEGCSNPDSSLVLKDSSENSVEAGGTTGKSENSSQNSEPESSQAEKYELPKTSEPVNQAKSSTIGLSSVHDLIKGINNNVRISIDGTIRPQKVPVTYNLPYITAVSYDNGKLFAVSEGKLIKLTHESGKPVERLSAISRPTAVCSLGNGKLIVGSLNHRLYLLAEHRVERSIKLSSTVSDLVCTSDKVFIGLADGSLMVADPELDSFKKLRSFHPEGISKLMYHGGKLLVGTYPSGNLFIVDPISGNIVTSFATSEREVSALAYYKGSVLVGTYPSCYIFRLDLKTGRWAMLDSMGSNGYITGIWSVGDELFVARYDGEAYRGEVFAVKISRWEELNWEILAQGENLPIWAGRLGKDIAILSSEPDGTGSVLKVYSGQSYGKFISTVYSLDEASYPRYISLVANGDVKFSIRTGETPIPGEGWTHWKFIPLKSGKHVYPLSAELRGRYFQFMVELAGEDSLVRNISLNVLRANNQPFGIIARDTYIVSPTGSLKVYFWDPDGDWLRLALYVEEHGKWQKISQKIVRSKSTSLTEPKFGVTELGINSAQLRRKFTSGEHKFKLVVDDSLSNPEDPAYMEDIRELFVDANSPKLENVKISYDTSTYTLKVEALVKEMETTVKLAELTLEGNFDAYSPPEFEEREPVLPLIPKQIGPHTWKLEFKQVILSKPDKVVLTVYDEANNIGKYEHKFSTQKQNSNR